MLVISRRKGQRITIGDEIEIVVTELHRSSVKIGIKAPREYAVLRGEIHDSIEEANRAAAETVLEIDVHFEGGTHPVAGPRKPESLLKVRQLAGGDQRQNGDSVKAEPAVVIRRRSAGPPSPPPPADTDPAEIR